MRTTVEQGRRGGFTLIEILVVVAIFGILATLAVSSFLGMSEKYKVESETKQLYADLMDARARAMQRNRFFFARIATTGYATFEDAFPAPDGDDDPTNGANIQIANVAVTHGITATGGVDNVVFNRNGIANPIGTIRFASPSTAKPDYDCITILATRIKMGNWNGTSCVEK